MQFSNRLVLVCSVFVFAAFAGCSTELDRRNAYDEQAAAETQRKGELSGIVTLESETDFAGTEIRLDGPVKTDASTPPDGRGGFALPGVDFQHPPQIRHGYPVRLSPLIH